jgi:hypothetical protein
MFLRRVQCFCDGCNVFATGAMFLLGRGNGTEPVALMSPSVGVTSI